MKTSDARKAGSGKGYSSSFLVIGVISAEIIIYVVLKGLLNL